MTQQHKRNNKKYCYSYLIIYLIILLLSSLLFWVSPIDYLIETFDTSFIFVSWTINILFIFNLFITYKRTKNILDFNNVFLLFLFLFCNGQTFLYSMGVLETDLTVFKVTTESEIVHAAIYFYFSMIFFQIGTLFTPTESSDKYLKNIDDPKLISAIKKTGFILMTVSIFPYLSQLFSKLKGSILYGYSYLYTSAQSTSSLTYLSKFFIPSLLLLLFVFKDKKRTHKLLLLFLFLLCGCNLIIGARGDALSIIVILIIFQNTFVKKYEGAKFVKVLFYICIIAFIIPVFLAFRTVENKNFNTLSTTLKEELFGEENFLIQTISELGYTVHSFVLTERAIPSIEPHRHGESYFASFMMIFPSFLFGGYSFANKAALDIWLQKIHNMSYGPGFSLTAETYYNFGWYGGMFATFFIGLFFSKIFNIQSKNNNKSILLKLLSLIFLFNSLLLVRFPFHSVPRNILYMFVIPYVLIMIDYGKIRREK